MKKYVFFLLISVLAVSSCKSKKKASASADSAPAVASRAEEPAGNTTGKVSHRYRQSGCATVITFMQDGTETTLIPSVKLDAGYDVDGLDVRFNYRLLKMPNPEGCNAGIPAEITDLSKK